jgi:hypothetical protein
MEELTHDEIQIIINLAEKMALLLNEARHTNLPYDLAKRIDEVLNDIQNNF